MPVALLLLHERRRTTTDRRPWSWWLGQLAILLVPLVIYFPLRYISLDYRLARLRPFNMLNPLLDANLVERIFSPFTIIGHYTRLFLWPARLSTEYGLAVIDPKAGPNAMTWLGVVAAVALLVGLAGYFRREGAWRRVALLCAIWLASYFLISNTLILFATPLAERLMYWPSVPLFILADLSTFQPPTSNLPTK